MGNQWRIYYKSPTSRKLGIHLAPGAFKLVELEEQAGKAKVLNYLIDYFPLKENQDALIKRLISSIKNKKIHTKLANLIISGSDVMYKVLELPEMPEADLAAAIEFKLKATLPFSFKDVVIDYYKIEELQRKGKQMFFVAAVPKSNILEAIKTVKALGLSVKNVIPPSTALRNSLKLAGPEPCALIYFGKYSSLIVLVKKGQVVFAREAKVGGESITQAMVGAVQTKQGKLELDYKYAEELKSKYGIPIDLEEYTRQAGVPAAEILAMMRPVLERIGVEMWNTFEFYRTQIGDETEFKRVYFTGGSSRIKNLLQYFGQIGFEMEPLPVNIESAQKDFAEKSPFLALALGSVISGKDQLSLLPKDERGGVLAGLKKRLAYISVVSIAVLALALSFGWFNAERQKVVLDYNTLQNEYQDELAKLGKKAEVMKKSLELAKYKKPNGFPLVMRELYRITPSNVYFKRIRYNKNTSQLLIDGIVIKGRRKISVADFMRRLNQSRDFKSVELIYMEKSDAYTVPTYDFKLKCLLDGERKK